MIPNIDTHQVAGSLNIIVVELSLPVDLSPVDLNSLAIAWQLHAYFKLTVTLVSPL